MILDIDARLRYALSAPTEILLQLEAAQTSRQTVLDAHIDAGNGGHFARVPAEEHIGERIWLRREGELRCDYRARVRIDRPDPNLANLEATPVHLLPGDIVKYLMASRYCPSDEFQSFVSAEFSDSAGGARMAALSTWIEAHFAYVPGSSNAQTTALDTFVQRQGICRDFAHVMVTLARASAVPARVASVYSAKVTPPDFHAVAEVYLDGDWHLVDATGMAKASEMAIIGVGRDAADISFMTSYGLATLQEQSVMVTESA